MAKSPTGDAKLLKSFSCLIFKKEPKKPTGTYENRYVLELATGGSIREASNIENQ